MNINESGFPEREISEGENDLLDKIWEKLPVLTDNKEIDIAGFNDLQRRICRKIQRRRMFRLTLGSGVAAVIAISFFIFSLPDSMPQPGVYTQLHDMGVDVIRDQVILTSDDGSITTLDSVARIEHQSSNDVSLLMSSGKKMAIGKERMLKIEVPVGRRFQLTLADGTEVWLNAGSSLEYPATFEGCAERRIRLQGEAFFEVKRDTNCPFCVELGKEESIWVLGTSFNVNAYSDSPIHTTTLLTGKISYKSDKKQQAVVLSPDQQVSLDCTAGIVKVNQVDAAVYAGWKEGWIYFENEKLVDLVQRLSRIYGIDIQVADRCKEYSFSGKIHFDRGIDYITRLITETTDVVCEVKEGAIALQ